MVNDYDQIAMKSIDEDSDEPLHLDSDESRRREPQDLKEPSRKLIEISWCKIIFILLNIWVLFALLGKFRAEPRKTNGELMNALQALKEEELPKFITRVVESNKANDDSLVELKQLLESMQHKAQSENSERDGKLFEMLEGILKQKDLEKIMSSISDMRSSQQEEIIASKAISNSLLERNDIGNINTEPSEMPFQEQRFEARDFGNLVVLTSPEQTDLPEGWLGCEELNKLRQSNSRKNITFRNDYYFFTVNYKGRKMLIKGMNKDKSIIYNLSKFPKKISSYLRITNNGREKLPGIPEFYGGCTTGDWWGVAMEFLQEAEVLCKSKYGDNRECAENPIHLITALKEADDPRMFAMSMTQSVLKLSGVLVQRKAFMEDFTGSNFMFDRKGNIFMIDFDSIKFYKGDLGFMSGFSCKINAPCKPHRSWMMSHGFAKETLGKCGEWDGICDTEKRVCSAFTASWMLCGFSHLLFERFRDVVQCEAYTEMVKCVSESDPQDRCSVPHALELISKCMPENSREQLGRQEESKKKEELGSSESANVPNVGYQPYRNYARWDAITSFLDEHHVVPKYSIDIGSNSGFFSMQLATKYRSHVFTVDTNDFYKGEFPMDSHMKYAKDLNILDREFFCKNSWHESHIKAVYQTAKRFDVQLVLSIFHWLKLKSEESANEYLKMLFLSSRVTFLELPQIPSKFMGEMGHWIGKRSSVKEIFEGITKSLRDDGHTATAQFLATTTITDNGADSKRDLWAVLVNTDSKLLLNDAELSKIFGCQNFADSKPVKG